MKKTIVSLALLLAGVVSLAQTRDCASLTQQALEVSGINQNLDQLSEQALSSPFLAQMAGDGANGAGFVAVFKPILQKHLNGAELRKEMQARMTARCNAEQAARTVEQLQSPLVSRMLALEAAADTPEGREKAQRYARAISVARPPDNRVDAIEAVDAAAGVTDYSVETILAVTRGMMTGAEADPEAVGQLAHRRKEMKEQLHGAVQAAMLSTYRSATIPDLIEYAKQLRTAPLSSFYDQTKRAMLEIVEEHCRAIGRDLRAAIKNRQT